VGVTATGGRMTGGGWPGGLGVDGIAGGNNPGTSGAGGGVVTSPTGADGGGVPSPTLPSSSFCAWHTPTSSKSPQQSPTARQSRSQQHDEVHSPHTPSQLPGSSRSVACRVSACHAGFDATRSDRATPSSSRRRRRSPTSGAWPASPSHPALPSSFRAIAPSNTGAFSLPSPPTRARPGPFPPTPPRATDHAHDNTVSDDDSGDADQTPPRPPAPHPRAWEQCRVQCQKCQNASKNALAYAIQSDGEQTPK